MHATPCVCCTACKTPTRGTAWLLHRLHHSQLQVLHAVHASALSDSTTTQYPVPQTMTLATRSEHRLCGDNPSPMYVTSARCTGAVIRLHYNMRATERSEPAHGQLHNGQHKTSLDPTCREIRRVQDPYSPEIDGVQASIYKHAYPPMSKKHQKLRKQPQVAREAPLPCQSYNTASSSHILVCQHQPAALFINRGRQLSFTLPQLQSNRSLVAYTSMQSKQVQRQQQ